MRTTKRKHRVKALVRENVITIYRNSDWTKILTPTYIYAYERGETEIYKYATERNKIIIYLYEPVTP